MKSSRCVRAWMRALCCGVLVAGAGWAWRAQADELPEPVNVPSLMKGDWATRRAEILKIFTEQEYGVRPVERPADLAFSVEPDRPCVGGKAVHRRVHISCKGPNAPFSFVADAYFPKGAKNVGGFICVGWKFDADAEDPSCDAFPVKDIIARGYAGIGFNYVTVADDNRDTYLDSGVFKAFGPTKETLKPDSWGTLSAWAWAMSRVLDWVETQPEFNPKRFGAVGHSRCGKTAIWAGATDTRFALTCSNDSGCAGAKLNHVDLPKSESVARISTVFPHWFARNYSQWGKKEMEMPFDQHMLLALCAPRRLAVASATKDDWAGPPGEFLAARLASPAWEQFGLKGLVAPEGFPKPQTHLAEGCVTYQLREGKHALSAWDWARYMDVMDKIK